jgi:competence transcription factor ComK
MAVFPGFKDTKTNSLIYINPEQVTHVMHHGSDRAYVYFSSGQYVEVDYSSGQVADRLTDESYAPKTG